MDELGELVKEYGSPRFRQTLMSLRVGGILVVLAILIGIIADAGTDLMMLAFVMGVFGGIIMVAGLLLIPGTLIRRNKKTRVFERGLISDWLKAEQRVIRWDDIERVTHRRADAGGVIGLLVKVSNYTLTLKDGQSVVISSAHVKDVDELGERIKQRVAS